MTKIITREAGAMTVPPGATISVVAHVDGSVTFSYEKEYKPGHKQGCPALGGYGTADRTCACGAQKP